MKGIYLHRRFYIYLSIIVLTFLLSNWFPVLYQIAWILFIILLVLMIYDFIMLFYIKDRINATRELSEKFSNSDYNPVKINISSEYPIDVAVKVIDELPFQFQKRDFEKNLTFKKGEDKSFEYMVRPVERGEYEFGKLNIYVSTVLKIFIRRFTFYKQEEMVKVYPSYIQMKKYQFLALNNRNYEYGLKKIRRLGHTMEFEQIKEYISGDDIRTINWKATGKHAKLMVNEYQDEKSQPIYSIIDTGRAMKMPFDGLKLLDYAINSALAFSNIALQKKDKAGLLELGKKVENFIPAGNKTSQLSKINEALYNLDTQFVDSDFEYLYVFVKRNISQRSLLIIYTNFEHKSSMNRQLKYLKALTKKHLVLVVIFENTELDEVIENRAGDIFDIYHKTVAEKFSFDKKVIVKELQLHGLFTILTKPEELTVNVINKYLEFKALGRI